MSADRFRPVANDRIVHPGTDAVAVLTQWYASNCLVRRLWAIEALDAIRIIVLLEPTLDGDDTQPAWLANSPNWARELRVHMQRKVRLEMINDPSHIESSFARHGAPIAEISWRDPSTIAD